MKRASILLAPPLAFVLAALLAWLAGSPAGKTIALDDSVLRSPRQREVAATSSGDPAAIAAQFANEMLIYRTPPEEVHDAEGMEAVIKSDNRTRVLMHGGMSWLSYSTEWAEESPAAMFAWLVHPGGSDFKERRRAASILFEKWAGKDMEAALAAVFEISNANLRQQALASSLEVLCLADPDRARELMIQNLDLFSADLNGSVLKQAPETTRREWVAAGFSAGKENAASFEGLGDFSREQIETTGNPRSADQFMETHGPAWAKRDLAGALGWAQAHLKGKARVERCAGLFESAASQDFDTALATWQTLPDGT